MLKVWDCPSKPMFSKVASTNAKPMAIRSPKSKARLGIETCQRESVLKGKALTGLFCKVGVSEVVRSFWATQC